MAASIKDNPFITVWRAQSMQYVKIPKALLACAPQLDISVDDALLYCLLRSRADYSLRNGWQDELNRVYIIYTREEAAKYLSLSYNKTKDSFRRLAEAGLIVEQEQRGRNNMLKAKKIYVKQWITPSEYEYEGGLSIQNIKTGMLPFVMPANIGENHENYYAVPRMLMEHEVYRDIPLKAKVLYAIALDSLHKSIMYGDNIDKNGLPYCLLSSSAGEEILQCSRRTMTSLYAALEDIGLFHRVRSGYGSDWRVYLRDFVPPIEDAPTVLASPESFENSQLFKGNSPDAQKLMNRYANFDVRTRKICGTDAQDLTNERADSAEREAQKMTTSEPSSQTPKRNLSSQVSLAAGRSEAIGGSSSDAPEKKNHLTSLENGLVTNLQKAYVHDPVALYRTMSLTSMTMDILQKDMSAQSSYIRLGNETLPKEQILCEYHKLTPEILQTLFAKILDRWDDIKKLPVYLHRALVTAVSDHEGESYYIGLENQKR